jgi:hypothetical protein
LTDAIGESLLADSESEAVTCTQAIEVGLRPLRLLLVCQLDSESETNQAIGCKSRYGDSGYWPVAGPPSWEHRSRASRASNFNSESELESDYQFGLESNR